MPRKTQISREMILDAAFEILRRDGYSAVNIKSVAEKLKCSTQPISWHFENMAGLRLALTDMAIKYVSMRMFLKEGSGLEAFENLGKAYVDLAYDDPNLFRFICMGESKRTREGGMVSILDQERNEELLAQMSKATKLSMEEVRLFMDTMIVYTHGLAALIAAGRTEEDRETMYRKLRRASVLFLNSLGVKINL